MLRAVVPIRHAEALRLRLFDFDIFFFGTAMTFLLTILIRCVQIGRQLSARPVNASERRRVSLVEVQPFERCPTVVLRRLGFLICPRGKTLGFGTHTIVATKRSEGQR